MSNLTEFLNQIGFSTGEVTTFTGNLIGTLADLSGAGGLIIGITSILSEAANIEGKLATIESEIKSSFEALGEEQRAEHILDAFGRLDPSGAQIQSVLDQLPDALTREPPVSQEFRLQQIQLTLDSIEQLMQEDKFLTNFADQVCYSDEWTGPVAPMSSGDGTVFCDRYVLPYFQRAIFDFLVTAAAYEADFAVRYQETLRRLSARLRAIYDQSASGLWPVRRPDKMLMGVTSTGYWSEFGYLNCPDHTQGWHLPGASPAITASPWTISGPITPELQAAQDALFMQQCREDCFQEYGVVHAYTGFSDLSFVPPIPLPQNLVPDDFFARENVLLDLATRRNWKRAHVAIGLSATWTLIKRLDQLSGLPDPGLDPGTSWTLSEIDGLLGEVLRPPRPPSPRHVSMSETVARLYTLAAVDRPPKASLRGALEAAFATVTLSGVKLIQVASGG